VQVLRSTDGQALDRGGPAPRDGSAGGSHESSEEYPLVLVEWQDAWFDLDLELPEDRRRDYVVRTVGFLVVDGPRFVSVAQEILPEGEGFRAVTHIPVQIVDRMTRLAAGLELPLA
jgi:hypothetical protein